MNFFYFVKGFCLQSKRVVFHLKYEVKVKVTYTTYLYAIYKQVKMFSFAFDLSFDLSFKNTIITLVKV